MKHTAYTLTAEVLTEIYGDSADWCSVFKNGKRVGYFADLRKEYLKTQALCDKKEKQKFHADLLKNDSIKDAKKYFEENIKNGEVFINRTQPNVHINGCKCYIICGPTEYIQLGIMHSELTFDEMQQIAGIEGRPSTSKRHILFDALKYDQARDLINLLCGK